MNMPSAPVTAEAARVLALQSYAILDTPAEEGFDQLARLAASICQCPMAVVNFVDHKRQWFKASVGMPFQETDRALSLCVHALTGNREPMVVPDATQNPLFADNPFVLEDPHVRFYACVPLVTEEGFALGTLAVIDRVPRHIQVEQVEALKILAHQAMVQLELRRQKQALDALALQRDQIHAELTSQNEALRVAGQIARIGGWIVTLADMALVWSPEIATTFGLARRQSTVEQILGLYTESHRAAVRQAFGDCMRKGVPFDLAEGKIIRVQGAFQDISAPHQAQEDRYISEERFHLVSRATADAVWDWDLRTDAMWWNEGMQNLFGVPLSALEPDSTSWSLRLHPDDIAEVLEGIEAAIAGTTNHWAAQYRFRRHDDLYAWVSDRGFLIRDTQGKALRMVGGMTDISAQKLAEIDARNDAKNHAELLHVQQLISSAETPLSEVLQLVANTVLHQTRARGALVELLQDGLLQAQAVAGDHVRPVGHALAVTQSLLWPTLSEGRTAVCNDTEAAGWDMQAMPHRHGVRSVMAVPLRSGGSGIAQGGL